MVDIRSFGKLSKKLKKEARERFKSPRTGYLYKITKGGKIAFRQKKRKS